MSPCINWLWRFSLFDHLVSTSCFTKCLFCILVSASQSRSTVGCIQKLLSIVDIYSHLKEKKIAQERQITVKRNRFECFCPFDFTAFNPKFQSSAISWPHSEHLFFFYHTFKMESESKTLWLAVNRGLNLWRYQMLLSSVTRNVNCISTH